GRIDLLREWGEQDDPRFVPRRRQTIQRQGCGACAQELTTSRGAVDVLERGRRGCGNVDDGRVWERSAQRGEHVWRRAGQNANAQTEAAGGYSGISDATP